MQCAYNVNYWLVITVAVTIILQDLRKYQGWMKNKLVSEKYIEHQSKH